MHTVDVPIFPGLADISRAQEAGNRMAGDFDDLLRLNGDLLMIRLSRLRVIARRRADGERSRFCRETARDPVHVSFKIGDVGIGGAHELYDDGAVVSGQRWLAE